MGTCFEEWGAGSERVLSGLVYDEGVALSLRPQTTSNSRTWCLPQWAQLAQVQGVLSLCLPSQQEQEVESTLRRKYTLIDKNDYAAISAVQKVSTPASCRQDSHQSFCIPRSCQKQRVSCIKADLGL